VSGSEYRNVTIRIRIDVYVAARVEAARRGTSLDTLVAEHLEHVAGHAATYEAARCRALKAMSDGHNLGSQGEIPWSRNELHER